MMREALRSLVREPVASVAATACVAVGVAVAAPLLSLVRVEAGWPPVTSPVVRPSALVGPLGDPSLAWSAEMVPVNALRAADLRALVGVLVAVGIVALLAAAVAVWVLVAARTRRRGRELRIRAAVGARRSDLRRQLRLEGGLLGLAGGALGTLLAAAAAGWIRAAGGRGLVWSGGGSTALAVVGAALLLLATAATAPGAAWGGRRRSRPPATAAPSPAPFQDLLVVGAVAVLVVVVVGAGLLVRSYAPGAIRAFDGAGPSDVAVLRLRPAGEEALGRRDAERALELAARHPDTVARALVSGGAWAGQGPVDRIVAQCLCWRGGAYLPVVTSRIAHAAVGTGYFEAFGVDLVSGREFRPSDRAANRRVAVVDRRYLRLMGGTSPLGKWIRVAGAKLSAAARADARYRIVGVVEARRVPGLGARGSGRPLVYLPAYLHPAGHPDLVVRTGGDPGAVGRELAASLGAEIPGLRVEARTLEQRTAALAGPLAWSSAGLGAASAGILLLAISAVGGLAADETRRQRAEMALRRAVGALRRQVVGRVLKRALGLGARAVVAGGVAAGGLAAGLNKLLYGLRVRDPLPWIVTLAVVVGAALLGSLVPALRASRQEPARWLGVRES